MPSLTINKKKKVSFGKLLIIAGPSCVGKSHLITKLQTGKHERVFKEINFISKHPPVYVSIGRLNKLDKEYYPAVILHLDILRLKEFYSTIFGVLTNVEGGVVVVTLCARRKVIVWRLCKRTFIRVWNSFFNGRRRTFFLDKFSVKWGYYKSKKTLLQYYSAWFQVLEETRIVENYVLDVNRSEVQRPLLYGRLLAQLLIGLKG